MMSPVKKMNRTLLLACAPFIGMMGWIAASDFSVTLGISDMGRISAETPPAIAEKARHVADKLDEAAGTAETISAAVKKVSELYAKTNESMQAMLATAKAQVNRPAAIYDKRITSRLGTPKDSVTSDKLRAQLFAISAQKFSGYALKVQLKSADAMKLALGKDELGGAETTLAAVKRRGAVAGINAGGFADAGGKRYPIGTTIVDGEYASGFTASYSDLFFVGINKNLKLVGGKFSSQEQLDKLQPMYGASFVPILRKNGVNQAIPSKWQSSPARAPRTVIANYKDNQLLFLVIDGRDENGSSGATLEEIQILLERYGAIDGYNLDGGGSSTLVFKGRVVNHPSDGKQRPLATNFLLFS
ncbi:phosphodiester glycosidase family protein [Cohnella algarum]|uniref:phosphodiester glycosidase family protein n=1 Tax=Cohnella algarum TaxID=2044859 RepID=UPI0019670618|nr:phosphodiester glycosidase family protein [Cohnella algarum]MBN2984924.1 phosphodiester glycosidase family protein [Cohnella algarum]